MEVGVTPSVSPAWETVVVVTLAQPANTDAATAPRTTGTRIARHHRRSTLLLWPLRIAGTAAGRGTNLPPGLPMPVDRHRRSVALPWDPGPSVGPCDGPGRRPETML